MAEVIIHSGINEQKFEAKIAATHEKRAQGLMFHEALEQNQAMLFLFENVRPRSFWMKDVDFDLDILFFDQDLKLNRIEHGIARREETLPGGASGLVLEIKNDEAKRRSIQKGDEVRFKITKDENCPNLVFKHKAAMTQ